MGRSSACVCGSGLGRYPYRASPNTDGSAESVEYRGASTWPRCTTLPNRRVECAAPLPNLHRLPGHQIFQLGFSPGAHCLAKPDGERLGQRLAGELWLLAGREWGEGLGQSVRAKRQCAQSAPAAL